MMIDVVEEGGAEMRNRDAEEWKRDLDSLRDGELYDSKHLSIELVFEGM